MYQKRIAACTGTGFAAPPFAVLNAFVICNRVPVDQARSVGIRGVHQDLYRGVRAARHVPAKPFRDNQNRTRFVAQKRLFRTLVHGRGDDFEGNRSAERINQLPRCR